VRANMKQQIEALIQQAIDDLVSQGVFSPVEMPEDYIERSREKAHGDWACTVALKISKQLGKNPLEIAYAIASGLTEDARISQVEVAGPGFINLTLTNEAILEEIVPAREQALDYAKSTVGAGQRVNVEFISANPTGPMHVGHGRWAALGNAICRLLEHTGWQVVREFYINDSGHQMDVFGNSVVVRYQQLLGENVPEPEEFYGGAYISDIAHAIYDEEGPRWNQAGIDTDERLVFFRERAYQLMLSDIQTVCDRVGVNFDVWFSERLLYKADEAGHTLIDNMLARLRERGCLYEKDGATWFRSTDYGDDKDRVVIKSDGTYTYFCPDIAYHLEKLERQDLSSGFLINIWGADHHGYVPRMQAALAALGHPHKLTILLGQLVNLYRDGTAVRMSKRTGEMVTFEELLDEVGADATKYLMLGRTSDQPIDFDIETAKRSDASNPVYYVQYAHARICSLLKRAAQDQLYPDPLALQRLTDSSELELARLFSRLAEIIEAAARDLAPNRLTAYAEELAAAFHSFYTRCPVITEDQELAQARLYLADATRNVLAVVLGILGVSAPERM